MAVTYVVGRAALDKLVELWRVEDLNVGFTRVIVGDCAGGDGRRRYSSRTAGTPSWRESWYRSGRLGATWPDPWEANLPQLLQFLATPDVDSAVAWVAEHGEADYMFSKRDLFNLDPGAFERCPAQRAGFGSSPRRHPGCSGVTIMASTDVKEVEGE